MIKVITYGTYDLLHYGHIRLLERAKALGDYLIVGVTADDFDKARGKINVQQSLMERIEAVRNTGIPDEIVIEEYEGQKIDDIRKYDVDIFTVGSDWVGKFDYLKEYCTVIYLERTEGVSSSEIREHHRCITLGIVGDSKFINKVVNEVAYVNGIHLSGICTSDKNIFSGTTEKFPIITTNFDKLLSISDAIYIRSQPTNHYEQIKTALLNGKHVLCESPICLNIEHLQELESIANSHGLILMEAIKTAYSTAYKRLLLLLKEGKIGKIVSISSTCTSLIDNITNRPENNICIWNGIYEWGPTALLPVFQLLGSKYIEKHVVAQFSDKEMQHDIFVKTDIVYEDAVATILLGNGVKSEGELIIAGTKGYAYIPAPWWKTNYFELRYENPAENKRFFYSLEGEGIRYELVTFIRSISGGSNLSAIMPFTTNAIVSFMQQFLERKDIFIIK